MKDIYKKITIFCSVSQSEIEKANNLLINSLLKQKRLGEIYLYFINYTGKDMVFKGAQEQGNIKIKEISSGKSLGFGEAHNFAFSQINPENYFLIVNPDVYLDENCIARMIDEMEQKSKVGIVEARQLPYEHPKEFDDATGETPWASGFCMLANSELFGKIGGFDDNFWMYCEDVDLSWRTWLAGYKVIYCKEATAYHFTGAHFEYLNNRFYIEQFWGARNFIYIAYKFWGNTGERKAKSLLAATNYPNDFKKEVLASFENLKNGITSDFSLSHKKKIKKLEKYIKIVDFNQYHEIR